MPQNCVCLLVLFLLFAITFKSINSIFSLYNYYLYPFNPFYIYLFSLNMKKIRKKLIVSTIHRSSILQSRSFYVCVCECNFNLLFFCKSSARICFRFAFLFLKTSAYFLENETFSYEIRCKLHVKIVNK